MARTFASNLRGRVRNFKLPASEPLVPLYEAVVNAINAIDERAKEHDFHSGKIEIEVLREDVIFQDLSKGDVTGFSICDNGIGFNEANMASFMEADSEHKLNIGGKGVGRFSWLKAFSSVEITSTYKDNDSFVTRSFTFSLDNQHIEDKLEDAYSETEHKTIVRLIDYTEKYKKEVPRKLDTIATRIIQHCLVYFLNDSCPEIEIYDDDKKVSLNQIFRERFSTDENTCNFVLGNQEFCLLNIKINDKGFHDKNHLYLCANDRLVTSRNLEKTITNLDSGIFENRGYWYLGVLTSSYLDSRVDMNRLSFDIPQEGTTLFPDEPSLSEIVQKASDMACEYLDEYLGEVGKRKSERFEKYMTNEAPQYRHLIHYAPEEIENLKPNLSNEDLDNALHSIKRDFENATKSECDKLMEKLEAGGITPEEYQKQFKETIEKVSDINKAALAEYVTHRKIILNLFTHGLNIKEDGKFNLEKYMHQLIYPMRTTSDDIAYESHNLWLLDERLAFCQFISSDKPFKGEHNKERADLLILDAPVVVAENENKGIAYDAITIFELKRPGRDDYTMENNPVTQLLNYAKKIKKGGVKDSKQRPIRVSQSTQFYLYAVCDITSSLEAVLENMDFVETPDCLGAYLYNRKLPAYIEVLSYDKIRNDSEKRNKVLFKKLGIYD